MMDARMVVFFCTVLSSSAAEVRKILTATEGGNITIPHAVRDNGFILFGPNVIAQVTNKKITLRDIYQDRLIWDQSTGLFTLTGLQRNDSGDYAISTSSVYRLTVYGTVPTPAVVSLSVSAESCTLQCSVDNAEDTTLSWHKDEETLNQISSALSLLLTVNKDFSSSYRCVAANPAENKTRAVDETLCPELSKPQRHFFIACIIKRKCLQTHENKRRTTQAQGMCYTTEYEGTTITWHGWPQCEFQIGGSSPERAAQVVTVGSCGLHTLHNALKAGFTVWQLEKLLRAMHFLFHNVPAKREDFTSLTGSSCFPLPFCGHRWVENIPVAERAVEVWPVIKTYVDAAEKKRVQVPCTASYDTIVAAQKDPFIIAKLQFFLAIARTFNPFLTKFQTDEPVLPFLVKDLTELQMSLLRRFVQRELLQDLTPLQLIKTELTDEKNLVSPKSVDIGLGAESAIKELQSNPGCKVGELSVLTFRRKCLQGLVKVVMKLQEKSPLKFPVVRQIACLDPTKMHRDPEWCIRQMKSIVQTFLQGKQLAGGIPAGDVIIQQFTSLLSLEGRDERFLGHGSL
ncbi:uncharacterized protein LOC121180926 isoform X2 [Toxotes jaculatrix]|uniref:uncharacterized protein LOC121180926 isoform X2 n=1 Tax=Toxotes jaculatrix TaxID=941984 RepID=UPI001B3B1365|nr:uncharacterized protein LOC121180926 isoform X2 [Toxotes jaculatrix]